jgi:FkbH-like protein
MAGDTTRLMTGLERISAEASYSGYTAVSNALKELGPQMTGLAPVRLALLRNFTAETLVPVIEGELALSGFHPLFYVGGFDAIAPDVHDPRSALYDFRPDFVIVAHWLETVAPVLADRFLSLTREAAEDEIDRVLGVIRDIVETLRRHSKVPVLLNNFPLPRYPTLGILDAQSDAYQSGAIRKLNSRLCELTRQWPDVYVVDFMGLVARVGSNQAIDDRYWHIGRAPIGQQALVTFGREYAKFVRALRGKTRKCLVLDCDNTLWGGIVGEDGPEGIKLGTAYPGSCFQAFQREILNLHDRGVILAICSKNNEADVLEVLRRHPEMLLREKHFATWQINWNDKQTNLLRIAERLNIGMDAIVIADDSRFECDFIARSLPEVAVLHLAGDPSSFASRLGTSAHFDSLALTTEDRERTQMYRNQVERKQLQESAGSLEEYLSRLEIVASIAPADNISMPRIAQLTQRTNQFNLTGRRYSEGEIRALSSDVTTGVYYLKMRDRVSELGLVGVAVIKYSAEEAEIDTFLVSCRALGRGAEETLLAHCIQSAGARGCRMLRGRYLRTNKNGQTAEFYSRHGFRAVSETTEHSEWELVLDRNTVSPPRWIKVEPVEFFEEKHAG